MRGRTALAAGAITAVLVAGRCIVAPSGDRPPGNVMVGVRPGLPPLKTTPTPWLRSPSPTAPQEATATPAPSPTPGATP